MNARRTARVTGAAALGLSALMLTSACQIGLDKKDASTATQNAATLRAPDPTTGVSKPTRTPASVAPTGIARIDGSTRGSLTASAASRYNRAGGSAEVSVSNNGAQKAFDELCRGSIDMVDSARSISADELATCESYGLQVVQFQFASDAVVLATKSETDVGGDCLTLAQVNNIYRAGSPVVNWRDVGFDNVPIRVGGPDRANNAFDFFGRSVLGAPEPSMTYLRSDYRAFADDAATRQFVVGTARNQERAKLAEHYDSLITPKKGVVARAVTNVRNAQAAVVAAQRERQKGIVDGRPAATQAGDQARLVAARSALTQARSFLTQQRAQLRGLQVTARKTTKARGLISALRGRLAYFRFTYYELFEDDLRPFEVSASSKNLNCIFPSEATITSGSYPLSRRLLLTTTTRSMDRTEVQDFLLKYLAKARSDAVAARLLPIPDDIVSQQQGWLRGTDQPRILTPGDLTNQAPDPEPAK